MRKVLPLLLAMQCAVVLVACGGTANSTGTPARTDTTVVPVTTTPGRTPDSATPLATATAARPAPETGTATAPAGPTRAATAAPSVATPTPLAVATATRAAPPAATTAPTTASGGAHVTSIPASPPKQAVGTQTDGLALLNVRAGSHDGYTRLVFDFAKTDGSAAVVPRAQVWSQQGAVVVMISGVRQDTFGQTLGRGEQAVNSGSVIALYRIPTFDDAAVAYGVSTKGAQGVTVTTSTGPARLIVDIAD